MPRCSVLTCKHDSRSVNVTNGGVSYHRFPKEPLIKEKWIDATGRTNWFPKPSNTICSVHFHPKDMLLTKKGYNYISDQAVPSRNFLSYHATTPPAEAIKIELALTSSRKRGDNFSTESSPAKEQKMADSEDSTDDENDTKTETDLPLEHIKIKVSAETSKNKSTKSPSEFTKARKIDDDEDGGTEFANEYENLSPEDKNLDSRLRYEQEKSKKRAVKMITLRNKLKRLKATIVDMEDLYDDLRSKRLILDEDILALQCIDVKIPELVARRQTNKELSEVVSKLTYSVDIRTFALHLHLTSPPAYDYIRTTYKTSLPHPRTLKHWHLKLDGDVGFTKEVFGALKRKADSSTQPVLATLILGEMRLKRCVEFDGKSFGYVDMGTGLDSDMLDEAKEVTVLSVTAVNGHFNAPVAYFLTSNAPVVQHAELVKMALEMAHDAGVRIVAVCLPGEVRSVQLAATLGCDLERRMVTFAHPAGGEPVVVLLDPSKLMHFLQDALRDIGYLLDEDGNPIRWQYLKQLQGTLYLSEKLKHQFVDYENARVKVKLASDVFSPRVVNVLRYCMNDLRLEVYKDSEPTQRFLQVCNTVYDVCNSTNTRVFGVRNNLNKDNADQILESLHAASEYINKILITKGRPLLPRYLQHFPSYVQGIKYLHENLIETNILETLCLHKLSYNHLNLFFWNIRIDARCKLTEDPTPKKVIFAYKKIVHQIKSNKSSLALISFPLSPSPVDRINWIGGQLLEKEDKTEVNPELEEVLKLLSNNDEVAVVQVAACIAQDLIKTISCDVCVGALVTGRRAVTSFIIAKDKARLLYPSHDVVKLCRIARTYLKGFEEKTRSVKEVMAKIMRQFVGSKIFESVSYHQIGEFPQSNHVTDLMKAVVERYAWIHHMVRMRIKRSTYRDFLAQLKEAWSQPLSARRLGGPTGPYPY